MLHSMRPMRSHSFVSTHTHTRALKPRSACFRIHDVKTFQQNLQQQHQLHLKCICIFQIEHARYHQYTGTFQMCARCQNIFTNPCETWNFPICTNIQLHVGRELSFELCAPDHYCCANTPARSRARARAHTSNMFVLPFQHYTPGKQTRQRRTDIGRVCAYVPAQILVRGIAQSLGVSDSDVADKLCHEFRFFLCVFVVLY